MRNTCNTYPWNRITDTLTSLESVLASVLLTTVGRGCDIYCAGLRLATSDIFVS